MKKWLQRLYARFYWWWNKIEKQKFDENWLLNNFDRLPHLTDGTLAAIISLYNKKVLSRETAFVLEAYEAFANDL